MKIQHVIPLLLMASYCTVSAQTNNTAAKPESIKLDSKGIPYGTLGLPVGSYLTIEGVKEKPRTMQAQHWLVDTVNGSKLTESVSITFQPQMDCLNDVDNWPKDRRFVFKGYEMFRMAGEPPALEAATKESGHELQPLQHMQQPTWRLYYYFVVTSVVAPKEANK